ncbi:peptidoglycan-binding protein [Noviherbaspirillum sp. 1P10PC]|uniref:peptidoglycan-binding protein n=1 Tax=Noviherbaspirillum sp. 1P10PC TaxID=3132292 RepID=UPI0039A2FC12
MKQDTVFGGEFTPQAFVGDAGELEDERGRSSGRGHGGRGFGGMGRTPQRRSSFPPPAPTVSGRGRSRPGKGGGRWIGGRWVGWPWPYPLPIPEWPDRPGEPPDDRLRMRWVQRCLNRVMNGRLRATGIASAPTRSLLRSFQRASGLPASGVLSRATVAALRAACVGQASAVARRAPPAADPGGYVGDSGDGGAMPPEPEPPEPGLPEDGPPVDGGSEGEFGDLFGQVGQGLRQAASAVGRMASVGEARIVDLTAQADKTLRRGTRDPKQVHAIVLHQMACCFRPKQPEKRFLSLNAHFAILADGRILQLHPLSALLWASNGFNARSVAVEFAGNFPNTAGKWWQGEKFGRDRVTPAQIEAGRALLRHLQRSIGLTHVLAHRQSSNTRDNDPGPDIWRHVGQWGIENLALKDGGPGFKIGSGSAIPQAWRDWGRPDAQPGTREWEAETLDARETVQLGEAGGSHSDMVRPVQRALNQVLGLRLPEDGIADPATRSAIRVYQRQAGMASTGKLDMALATSLKRELGGAAEMRDGMEQEHPVLQTLRKLPPQFGQVQWKLLGSLAPAALRPTPFAAGVYVILLPTGMTRQAYVGQAANLGSRLKQHLWCLTHMGQSPKGYRVVVAKVDNRQQRKALEGYINKLMIPLSVVTNRKINELETEISGWQ